MQNQLVQKRLCPCDPPGIQAASSSKGCSSHPLWHLLGRRSLPHKVCNCADGIKLKSYQRKSYALGIHQASKQPPLQEAAGGHSLTNFETVLMDSINSYSIIAFSGVHRHFQQQPFFHIPKRKFENLCITFPIPPELQEAPSHMQWVPSDFLPACI